MSTWLYQLDPKNWPPEMFRYEVREGERWRWRYGRKRGSALVETGDTLVFFYARSGGSDPGVYGWAFVERCDAENSILYFMPVAPTDQLKMDPWWDDKALKVTDEIRGRMKQATLFQVPDGEIPGIRAGIRQWSRSRA